MVNEVIAAKDAFKQRVHEWAAKLDVKVAWLGVRPMRNKWASYSTNGHLNFNSDLLDLETELVGLRHRSRTAPLLRPEPWKVVEKPHEGASGRLRGIGIPAQKEARDVRSRLLMAPAKSGETGTAFDDLGLKLAGGEVRGQAFGFSICVILFISNHFRSRHRWRFGFIQ